MEIYIKTFFEMGWPVILMLAAERFAVSRFLRTPAQVKWVRDHWWLHPNSISRARYPMGVISALILYLGYPRLSIWFFSFWMITDLTDGAIARRCDLSSEKGASIDPLSDKLMYIPALAYLSYLGYLDWVLVMIFVIIDVIGQYTRMLIDNKSANLFGKAKTFLVVMLLIATTIEMVYGNTPHAKMLDPLLFFCVGLAFCSVAFKVIPNYWYANILSLLNLVCGIAGIIVIFMGKNPIYAFGLVFLGQFLDLFDGRAAERWGSTPKGEMFDDVADGTNFGATVGVIVATSFESMTMGVTLGAIHLIATIYRLYRFIMNKRKAGIEGGVEWFSGMPSPGGALLAGSAALLIDHEIARAGFCLLTAFLMVSTIPYPHVGRSMLPKIPMVTKVFVLAGFTILLAFAVKAHNYTYPLVVVFLFSLAYMVIPVFMRKGEA